MKILAIDTSVGRNLSLAVSDDAGIISCQKVEPIEDLSLGIVPSIEKLLRKARLSLDLIDGFALSIGPGSFTGLRIGLSCIKALSLATGKPLVGVASLDILAEGLAVDYQICSVIDAKRKNVYACLYSKKNGKLKINTAYLLMDVDCLLKKINKKTLFVGDALYLYRDKIIQQKNGICFFAEEKFWYPKIGNLVRIAFERFQKGLVDDLGAIVPVYLYPKECQIRKS